LVFKMRKMFLNKLSGICFPLFLLATLLSIPSCSSDEGDTEPLWPVISRTDSVPSENVKMTPETDLSPPILHSTEWQNPVPVGEPINTAGGEDSPFIPADRDELYFFFTPDVQVPAEQQVLNPVTGIYVSRNVNGIWQMPEKVWLQDPGKLALDGAEFVSGNEMYFATTREGYAGIHWFKADYIDQRWTNWQNADFNADYQVGELHIHGNELYYHSSRSGGKGNYDIWKLTKNGNEWQNPENIDVVNTSEIEGWPYITPDGNELWFTRVYMGAPAIYRSVKSGNEWQEPELIISQFAGEPTLDSEGNIYFVHHYYINGKMIEADIYVAYKK
jgi:hypothetical protein